MPSVSSGPPQRILQKARVCGPIPIRGADGLAIPPQIMRWRAGRIVALVLKALLVLSASFALIALGIFLIRGSR